MGGRTADESQCPRLGIADVPNSRGPEPEPHRGTEAVRDPKCRTDGARRSVEHARGGVVGDIHLSKGQRSLPVAGSLQDALHRRDDRAVLGSIGRRCGQRGLRGLAGIAVNRHHVEKIATALQNRGQPVVGAIAGLVLPRQIRAYDQNRRVDRFHGGHVGVHGGAIVRRPIVRNCGLARIGGKPLCGVKIGLVAEGEILDPVALGCVRVANYRGGRVGGGRLSVRVLQERYLDDGLCADSRRVHHQRIHLRVVERVRCVGVIVVAAHSNEGRRDRRNQRLGTCDVVAVGWCPLPIVDRPGRGA